MERTLNYCMESECRLCCIRTRGCGTECGLSLDGGQGGASKSSPSEPELSDSWRCGDAVCETSDGTCSKIIGSRESHSEVVDAFPMCLEQAGSSWKATLYLSLDFVLTFFRGCSDALWCKVARSSDWVRCLCGSRIRTSHTDMMGLGPWNKFTQGRWFCCRLFWTW